ncbi:outer membrane protein [Bradyrhizobium liaoningense]|uniref:outer membrane protein n=1 Tax=Bradyrhizobium liaoningense TaxID=43992 RepID=UPI001FCF7C93|nr:porin family protein [Bradyrhizobium liaoningense]
MQNNIKTIVLALTTVTAMTGAASAADLGARPYTKAPIAAAPVVNWTGCYIGAGGGGAMTNNDHNETYGPTTFSPIASNASVTSGARGWFGTVQVGCDYQLQNWVVGAFADYDFMDVKGDIGIDGILVPRSTGSQKQDQQWAVGARAGYLIAPQLLTYVSAGYTQAHWKSTALTSLAFPGGTASLGGATKGGWFIGAGDEYALTGFLPGLFWKTEYRYSEFDRADVVINYTGFGGPATGFGETQKFREHSVRSELVYRFNWGAPLVAKY